MCIHISTEISLIYVYIDTSTPTSIYISTSTYIHVHIQIHMSIHQWFYITYMTTLVVVIIACSFRSQVIEPFTRQFFNQILPIYFVGLDRSQMFGNEFIMVEAIRSMNQRGQCVSPR